MSIEVELKVGMIDMSLAQLLTNDHRIIEFPSILLPDDVVSGSIVKLSCERSLDAELQDKQNFKSVQKSILSKFTRKPQNPSLRVHNFTQTSVVLEWDVIDPGSAELLSLALYKNGQQLGVIPNPERRTSTKLSNLEIDKPYQFELVLNTSAGTFKSNLIDVRTQRMDDLSGLTICVGSLEGSEITLQDIEKTIERIGCRPLQHEVQLDTTHFICTEPDTNQYVRAQARNMPIVRPQWLNACENDMRIVEVRQYYLSEDPRLMAPHRVRRGSVATAATADMSVIGDSEHHQGDEPEGERTEAIQSSQSSDHPAINVVPPEETQETSQDHPETAAEPTPAPEPAAAKDETSLETDSKQTEVEDQPVEEVDLSKEGEVAGEAKAETGESTTEVGSEVPSTAETEPVAPSVTKGEAQGEAQGEASSLTQTEPEVDLAAEPQLVAESTTPTAAAEAELASKDSEAKAEQTPEPEVEEVPETGAKELGEPAAAELETEPVQADSGVEAEPATTEDTAVTKESEPADEPAGEPTGEPTGELTGEAADASTTPAASKTSKKKNRKRNKK